MPTNYFRQLFNFSGIERNGIKGAYDRDNFLEALAKNGGRAISESSINTDGITHIRYEIPIFDGRNANINSGKGNIIGYREVKEAKTVYNPTKYSDEKMLNMAQQAAAKGYRDNYIKLGLREYTESINNISFRIYVDRITGAIQNVHPN